MYEYKITKIMKVVDGDTVDVILDLGFDMYKKERVRLAGIDTPESRTRDLEEKEMGLGAKEFLIFLYFKFKIIIPKGKLRFII